MSGGTERTSLIGHAYFGAVGMPPPQASADLHVHGPGSKKVRPLAEHRLPIHTDEQPLSEDHIHVWRLQGAERHDQRVLRGLIQRDRLRNGVLRPQW